MSEENTRQGILDLIESFVDKIHSIRRLLAGISISALVLAPFATGMSIYLITHEHFYFILYEYDEFGLFLAVLLGIIIAISLVWLVLGVRQYLVLKSWNERYLRYLKRRDEVDRDILSKFKLDEDQ